MRAFPALALVALTLLASWPAAGSPGAPTFRLMGAVAQSGVQVGAGEPSVAAAPDGMIYVTFPGCETMSPAPVVASCEDGPVYRSADVGASWTRDNDAAGRLAPGAPAANLDADVAVDAAGNAYAIDLGGAGPGVHIMRRPAGAAAWEYLGDVAAGGFSDRPWVAAGGPGLVIVGQMDAGLRNVVLRASQDGGVTFGAPAALGKDIGWVGPLAFASDGRTAFVPYTQPTGIGAPNAATTLRLWVGRTTDGGASWSALDTGLVVPVPLSQVYPSNGAILGPPALAVTGTGRVVLAWSEYVSTPTPVGVAPLGAVVKVASSADGGASWSAPLVVDGGVLSGGTASAIMP